VAPTTTTSPKRITWASSVTSGVSPITKYQSSTINPGQTTPTSLKGPKIAADQAAFLSASITIHQVTRAAHGPSAAPPHGARADASGDNDYRKTTSTMSNSAHANTMLSSIITWQILRQLPSWPTSWPQQHKQNLVRYFTMPVMLPPSAPL
jgi:hypothetical protein